MIRSLREIILNYPEFVEELLTQSKYDHTNFTSKDLWTKITPETVTNYLAFYDIKKVGERGEFDLYDASHLNSDCCLIYLQKHTQVEAPKGYNWFYGYNLGAMIINLSCRLEKTVNQIYLEMRVMQHEANGNSE